MEDTSRHYEWYNVSGWVNVLEYGLLTQKYPEAFLSGNDSKDTQTFLNSALLKTTHFHAKHPYEYETLPDEYYYNRLHKRN